MRHFKVKITLLLSIAAFNTFVVKCGARIAVSFSNSGRSSIWDNTINQLRERRQVRSWQETRYTPINGLFIPASVCTLNATEITQFDTLGRRNRGLLSEPLAQGYCGSCWAFASSTTFTDLRNLAVGQKLDSNTISPEYAAKCISTTTGNGCCGGSIGTAANHFRVTGTTTYQCLSYTLRSYFTDIGGEENKGSNPLSCPRSCTDGSNYNTMNLRLMDYRQLRDVSDSVIIDALRNVGPIAVSMKPDMTFGSYLCGVYSPTVITPSASGSGHAVEIVDYGTTNTGIDFWVVKNSWGRYWGENGYIRIKRGELFIGTRQVVIQYISGQPSVQSNANDMNTCAVEEVSAPQSNVFVQSALEYGLQELLNRQLVQCPNGSSVNSIMQDSIINATDQTVTGNIIQVTVLANVQGCRRNVNPVTIELEVYIDPDGDFSLTEYEYTLNRSKATVMPTILLTLLTVGIGALLQIV